MLLVVSRACRHIASLPALFRRCHDYSSYSNTMNLNSGCQDVAERCPVCLIVTVRVTRMLVTDAQDVADNNQGCQDVAERYPRYCRVTVRNARM